MTVGAEFRGTRRYVAKGANRKRRLKLLCSIDWGPLEPGDKRPRPTIVEDASAKKETIRASTDYPGFVEVLEGKKVRTPFVAGTVRWLGKNPSDPSKTFFIFFSDSNYYERARVTPEAATTAIYEALRPHEVAELERAKARAPSE